VFFDFVAQSERGAGVAGFGVVELGAEAGEGAGAAGLDNLKIDRLSELAVTITVMLVILAAANTTFITWATVVDARQSSALGTRL
jgi:hypothetical protein